MIRKWARRIVVGEFSPRREWLDESSPAKLAQILTRIVYSHVSRPARDRAILAKCREYKRLRR